MAHKSYKNLFSSPLQKNLANPWSRVTSTQGGHPTTTGNSTQLNGSPRTQANDSSHGSGVLTALKQIYKYVVSTAMVQSPRHPWSCLQLEWAGIWGRGGQRKEKPWTLPSYNLTQQWEHTEGSQSTTQKTKSQEAQVKHAFQAQFIKKVRLEMKP